MEEENQIAIKASNMAFSIAARKALNQYLDKFILHILKLDSFWNDIGKSELNLILLSKHTDPSSLISTQELIKHLLHYLPSSAQEILAGLVYVERETAELKAPSTPSVLIVNEIETVNKVNKMPSSKSYNGMFRPAQTSFPSSKNVDAFQHLKRTFL